MNDPLRSRSEAPVFVVGAPRSGTTLAASILSAHPALAVAPETHFFPLWVRAHGKDELEGDDDFRAFWHRVSESPRFGYLGVDEDRVLERVRADERPPTYRAVFRALLREYAAGLDKERWGEKTPAHERWLGRLLEWFPGARVVFMVRDPRAVALSLAETPWGRGTPPDLHAVAWAETMERARGWRADERVLFVGYEALASEPETETRRLCAHVGETFDPAMLHDRSTESSPIVNREGWAREHLERALEPVTDDRVERWRTALSPGQVARVEHVVRDRMAEWGYEPLTPEMGPFRAALSLAGRTWSRVRRRVRELAEGRRPGAA